MWNYYRKRMMPARYQGDKVSGPYFEGWYYKLVSADGGRRLAVIPGIFIGKKGRDSHAFIQLLDGVKCESRYFSFDPDLFSFEKDRFHIGIGESIFRAEGLELNVQRADGQIRGRLTFEGVNPWPVSLRAPGIMGWYGWLPFMQCFHAVPSMDHGIEGQLEIDGESWNFDGGRGYIEKDWGRSFPRAYVWMQCNHFEKAGTSLTASVAHIPWILSSFSGFIAGLYHENELYRFATYNGAKLQHLRLDEKRVQLAIGRGEQLLEILTERKSGGSLLAPTGLAMDRRVTESMDADLEVRLTDRGQELFHENGRFGGLEVVSGRELEV